ncbi:phosphoglycerate dehydrogenase-like enzyme [Humitalea rosea]|uniref:Phosphoglycerate dehydrogenase-like enzyme n=1 Tax=Humitalea rosea TaxID=990373 RepID=A0A2W7IHA7_9PROT|nr:D-2-hydroxyacid dehydrogenase [Humitalea rosea]PZW45026.1 phosphoglycerate dehydrogenase-like enzyme [Humitalea rosea]
MFPSKSDLTICFAHPAYRFQERFEALGTGLRIIQVRDRASLEQRLGEADVLVISGLWKNDLIPLATKLRFVQSVSAGVDQYGQDAFRAAGIRLASAQGANVRAVSEHAMSLILALARRLPEARDNQARKFWRGMVGDLSLREDELGGKTLLVVGIGGIGGRLARLAKAFDMNVIGIRRDPAGGLNGADEVHALSALKDQIPRADYVALTCPLTPETTGIINAETLALMKPSSFLINVARGKVCVEADVADVMARGAIAGAGLDTFEGEPLSPDSPLWTMPNVIITPHSAGETRRYEDNVIALLLENLDRLGRGETVLKNQIV